MDIFGGHHKTGQCSFRGHFCAVRVNVQDEDRFWGCQKVQKEIGGMPDILTIFGG